MNRRKITDETKMIKHVYALKKLGLDDLIWKHVQKLLPEGTEEILLSDEDWLRNNVTAEYDKDEESYLVKYNKTDCIKIFKTSVKSSVIQGDNASHNFVIKTNYISYVGKVDEEK